MGFLDDRLGPLSTSSLKNTTSHNCVLSKCYTKSVLRSFTIRKPKRHCLLLMRKRYKALRQAGSLSQLHHSPSERWHRRLSPFASTATLPSPKDLEKMSLPLNITSDDFFLPSSDPAWLLRVTCSGLQPSPCLLTILLL